MSRVLITGGAGYVGSMVAPLLLAGGHQVRVFDRLTFGGAPLLACCDNPGFELVPGDVCDARAVAAAMDGMDLVVHLAAVVGYPACDRDPVDAVRTNVGGTSTLLAARRPGQRLIFASTASIYGASPCEEADESTAFAPSSLYAETKVDGEQLVRAAGDAVVLRFATAFGVSPRMRFDLLPNAFVRTAVEVGRLSLFQPHFRRSFLHVTDAARALVHTIACWDQMANQTFNVGNPAMNMTKLDLAEMLGAYVPCEVELTGEGYDSDRRNCHLSYERLLATGFRASVDMQTGLRGVVTAVQLTRDDRERSGVP